MLMAMWSCVVEADSANQKQRVPRMEVGVVV